jgi:hypothetical protein
MMNVRSWMEERRDHQQPRIEHCKHTTQGKRNSMEKEDI